MTANTAILKRSYDHFVNSFKNSSIEKYFGINTSNSSKLKISISKLEKTDCIKNPTKITLRIYFFKSENIYNFNNLPIEIIREIQEYGNHFIDMEIDIYFPNRYPFIQPLWCLKNIKHNIKLEQPINIENYYYNIINNHNNQNKKCWSAATKIETDIVEFIRKINHFEYLFYDS
jgi:hypothetical protein